MGPHCVAEPDLELLDCCDPPTSASKVAGTVGLSHSAWRESQIFNRADGKSIEAEPTGPG